MGGHRIRTAVCSRHETDDDGPGDEEEIRKEGVRIFLDTANTLEDVEAVALVEPVYARCKYKL